MPRLVAVSGVLAVLLLSGCADDERKAPTTSTSACDQVTLPAAPTLPAGYTAGKPNSGCASLTVESASP